MKDEDRAKPSLATLDPSTVKKDWEGVVVLHGSDLTDCLASFDARFPKLKSVEVTRIEAIVTAEITGTVGKKEVLAHRLADGALSNPLPFTVVS